MQASGDTAAELGTRFGGPTGPVVQDLRYCIRCGYGLVGLPLGGGCPECGTSIELSLREPTLANASQEYLKSIKTGLSLVLNGIMLTIVLGVVSIPIGMAASGTPMFAMLPLATTFVGLGISAMIFIGYWKYTEPDPGQVATEATNSARTVVRVAVAAQAVLALANLGLEVGKGVVVNADLSTLLDGAVALIGLLNMVSWLVQFIGVLRYTRWLATRIPDQWVLTRTKRYQWLLPVISIVGAVVLLLGPLIALVLYWNLLDRMRKHVRHILDHGTHAQLKGTAA